LPSQFDEFYHVFNNILTQLTSCVSNNVEVERRVTFSAPFVSQTVRGLKRKRRQLSRLNNDLVCLYFFGGGGGTGCPGAGLIAAGGGALCGGGAP
jgi:hypothetical protein